MRLTPLLGLTALSAVCLLSAQTGQDTTALTLGSSLTEFTLTGQGSGTTSATLNLSQGTAVFSNGSQTVNCVAPAGGYLLACGSASGSGAAFAESTSAGAAYYMIWSPGNAPLTLVQQTNNDFALQENAPVYLVFTSPQGSLNATLDLDLVTEDSGTSAVVTGSATITGGSFASAFGSSNLSFSAEWAIGASLNAILGNGGVLEAQFDYPGSLVPAPAQAACDFLTGGGWIPNSGASGSGSAAGQGNGKATFGVEGGCKNGQGWGHLTYVDHGSGLKVQGRTDADCSQSYQVVSNGAAEGNNKPTGCRLITGHAEVNGVPGFTYSVTACDNGGGHGTDTFTLSLSNGYKNSGTLGGGTIELHAGQCGANGQNCPSSPGNNGKGNGNDNGNQGHGNSGH